MSDADEDGFDFRACPQHDSHNLALVDQTCERAGLGRRFVVCATKSALGTPDGRAIHQQPGMTGQPESARMSQPVTVKDEDLGLMIEFAHRIQSGWDFPKTQ